MTENYQNSALSDEQQKAMADNNEAQMEGFKKGISSTDGAFEK